MKAQKKFNFFPTFFVMIRFADCEYHKFEMTATELYFSFYRLSSKTNSFQVSFIVLHIFQRNWISQFSFFFLYIKFCDVSARACTHVKVRHGTFQWNEIDPFHICNMVKFWEQFVIVNINMRPFKFGYSTFTVQQSEYTEL